MYTHVHSSIVHDSQKVETPQIPTIHEWINKLWYVHTVEYYLAIKRNEVLIHAIQHG